MVNCLFKKLNFVNSLRRGLSSHFNFLSPFSFFSSPFLQHSNLTNRARYFPQSGRFKWIDRPPLRAYGWDCHSIWHHSGLWYCKQRTTQCHSTRKKLYSSNTSRGKRFLLSFKPREAGYESVYYGINNTRPMWSERAHLRLAAFSSLVFIGPRLNEIQLFENYKI